MTELSFEHPHKNKIILKVELGYPLGSVKNDIKNLDLGGFNFANLKCHVVEIGYII